MDQPPLSRDSHVVLLLASHLGSADDSDDSGLGPAGWHDFHANLRESELSSPGELLELDPGNWPDDVWSNEANREWVADRLGRSRDLAGKLENLDDRGIWVTTRFDSEYPEHLHETLERKAPPYLYVAGEAENLHPPAVGFVGSRDADADDEQYTRTLVEKVTNDGFGIVSGGARGIDKTSEAAGLERGGPVVEFPVEGLETCLQTETIREAVSDGLLTLASHYHPEASWNMGAAMGRNKLIHGFADYTVVVRSGHESGGTWAGATENLDNGWSTLLVCRHDDTPPGNEELVERGGVPLDPTAVPADLAFEEWVHKEREAVDVPDSTPSETNDGEQQSSLDRFG